MNKKSHHLYNEIQKAENNLLAIRSRLLKEDMTPEMAAVKVREVSVHLTELAISMFRNIPEDK